MTTITEKPEEQLTLGQATKPSGKWVNWWRKVGNGQTFAPIPGGRFIALGWMSEGTEHPDNLVWPSKEIAEQKAQDEISGHTGIRDVNEYLGPREVGP